MGGGGVPKEVLQYAVTDSKNKTWLGRYCLFLFLLYYFQVQTIFILIINLNYRGTVISVVLEGTENTNNIVAYYAYKTNPVRFIYMCYIGIIRPQIFVRYLILFMVLCVRYSF